MITKLLCCLIFLPFTFIVSSFSDGASSAQKTYSFVFPEQKTVLTKENVLTAVMEIMHDSIADAIIYVPWDSSLGFSFSSNSEVQTFLEKSLEKFPQQLLAKEIAIIGTPYHFLPETTTSFYQFSTRQSAKNLLIGDTSKAEYKALRRYDNRIRVEISGWMPITIQVNKKNELCGGKYFSFSTNLLPGINTIPIEFISPSKFLLFKDSLLAYYEVDLNSSKIPEEFVQQVFHTKNNEAMCGNCHNTNSQNKVSESECTTCHKEFEKQKYVHSPVSSNDCLVCHQDRTKGFTPIYSHDEENQTCFACHDNVQTDVSQKQFVHAPLVGEQCSICHSPHASSNPSQLRKSKNELCLSCHDSHRGGNHPVMFHPNSDVADPRNKDIMLSCVSCHDPHTSENKSLLINPDGYFALCQSCHSK